MVTSSPLMSAQAVCATSGCQALLLLGLSVSHHNATSANAPKTMASFSSFPRTKMIVVIRTNTNRNAENVRAVGKSKYSAQNAHAEQITAAIQAIAQAVNRSAFMAATSQDTSTT